jgi:hypothetical protein
MTYLSVQFEEKIKVFDQKEFVQKPEIAPRPKVVTYSPLLFL